MKRYKKLYEFAQRGNLYHFTSPENMRQMLFDNAMKVSPYAQPMGRQREKYTISFTRSFSGIREGSKFYEKDLVRLTVKGGKISENYKIVPYNWFASFDATSDDPWDEQKETQSEEAVIFDKHTGKIKNLNKYIIRIDIVKDALDQNLSPERIITQCKAIEQMANDRKIPFAFVNKWVSVR